MKSTHNDSTKTSLSALNDNNFSYFSLPYLPKISEKLAQTFKNQCSQIKISFCTSDSKLKTFLSKLKDNFNPLQKHGIYKLNGPCGKFYIGRTTRNFKTRCKEHIAQINVHLKRGTNISSAFSSHVIDAGHVPLITNNFEPQILYSGGNSTNFLNSLECLEILLQKSHNPNIVNNITEYNGNCFLPHAIKYL
jgi:hypothetical protein